MVVVALVIRLTVMVFLLPDQFEPTRPGSATAPEMPMHFHIGFECGQIASSIVQGKGYASPLFSDTGPTAWLTPACPYIVAGAFKIFGTFSMKAVVALLSLQALMSALVCAVVFFITLRTFGERVAKWAGWAWALCPYGIYFPVDRIWETWLATLILCALFLITLHLEKEDRLSSWAGFGALWALGALTSPAMLPVLPFLAFWVIYRRHRLGRRWLLVNAVATIAFIAVVTPWFVRNYTVFHRFIPFRDSMGMTLLAGANDIPGHWKPQELGPWNNMEEWNEFQQVGELAYMDHKKQEAIGFIKAHPGVYAWKALRRAVFIWTGYWSLDREYLKEEPLDPPNIFLCTTLTVLALVGLRRGWRADWSTALPYLCVLLAFPAIYYITTPELYYRRPIDPFVVILAVVALVPRPGRPPLKKRSLELKEEGDPEVAYSTM